MHLRTENPEEIFAEAIQYFKDAQGQCQIGTTAFNFCTYLNDKGQRCVAGHFVVDETAADQRFLHDFKGSIRMLNTHARLTTSNDALTILTDLQEVHDFCGSWDDYGNGPLGAKGWERMRAVGEWWGFDTSEIPV